MQKGYSHFCIDITLHTNIMKQIIALAGLLLALLPASAEKSVWCMMTDSGIAVEMSQVTCLVAADNETTFGIVLQDGTILSGVHRVTFDQTIPTGIEKPEETIFRVNKELGLDGVAPGTPVRVYDTDGKLRQKGTARLISLQSLPTGIYIIQVNNTSFKIIKQ